MTTVASPRSRARAVTLAVSWAATAALVLGMISAGSGAAVAQPAPAAATVAQGPVKTADLSKFQPGHIISDAAFFDKGTMSEAQIQAFLQAKVPNCQSGYICLKDWYDTSRTTAADAMCGAYSGGTRERASTIIYKVAQACGINPQVLIVMLQKEQGLVNHTWPSDWRYTIAMGQGCPDTAACDTRYYGFFNQMYGAAWQLKRYANPAGTSQYFTWYAPGKTWNVRWHPNEACGSSPVYIQNQATANLYYYTPYQPNAAAIRAGYGEGDGCSSYGNRNFYQYFTDWFGSTPLPTVASVDSSAHVTALDSSGTLWAYPFAAGGSWGTPIKVASMPDARRALAVGDLDGDGHRDVIGVSAGGMTTLYLSDGGTTYGRTRPLGADWSGAVLATAAGDFDGDGAPDAFTTNGVGDLLLWRNTGAGRLRAPIVVGTGWGGMSLLSGGADMDGDGAPDLVARHSNGNLYLYTGNGSGSWRGSTQIGSNWWGMTAVFSPGDFSGDGVRDILARDTAGGLWHYYGAGGGRIAGGTRVGNGWSGMVDIAGTGPDTANVRVFPAGAGDVDGDRARDVLALTEGGQLLAYRGDGTGGWRGSSAIEGVWPIGSRLVTMGDFSGDGAADLGRVLADGTFELLKGRGDSTYEAPIAIGNGWSSIGLLVGGVDFDGDRNVDVVGRDASGNLVMYRGDGVGGWLGGLTTVGNGWGGVNALFYAGDFDGDSAPDMIARLADGALWLYPGSGSGGWRTPRAIGVNWFGFTAIIGAGNFDGSGGPDVLARTAGGLLYLYRGDGRGGWQSDAVIGQGWNGMIQLG
ncbi:VCBS repeat-containing protein [Microbacterium sp. zg.B48]|uniref:FG-GAP repeat domain-containing protein n=1 Tax=unclassified Microbacterium TaxID=2609290 RepID=UPI00214B57A1|nr:MULTISPECIES: VCBS repeat-containing protein [unclassified Microbacterium]MCR2765118.1 VCBS repeat-containing protein [Microbacterium sp. zg.B48]MCR2810281.1 VCBS repeat-containing protein [Microbacterium sp. zg.B185]WIM19891.1 VCBS repeat-containing protein [Microbacterium sp. zg-B185]